MGVWVYRFFMPVVYCSDGLLPSYRPSLTPLALILNGFNSTTALCYTNIHLIELSMKRV